MTEVDFRRRCVRCQSVMVEYEAGIAVCSFVACPDPEVRNVARVPELL